MSEHPNSQTPNNMNKFLPMLFAFFGCGCSEKTTTNVIITSAVINEATKVEYRYGDSSLPPDYHRSYTINITENKKTISIDSYGKVLLTKEYTNTPADFQTFKEELAKTGIKKQKEKKSNACTGGTSETLRLYNTQAAYFDAYVYHCDGETGTLLMPREATQLICNQIPENLDSLINSTIRN